MCGIFGTTAAALTDDEIGLLVHHSEQRGRDSSGLLLVNGTSYTVAKANFVISRLVKRVPLSGRQQFFGHSRLITTGMTDNQPVVRGRVVVIHNGIVVNHEALWTETGLTRHHEIDTEIIAALIESHLDAGGLARGRPLGRCLSSCRGVVACAVAVPSMGQLALFSNNGSLYVGEKAGGKVFASERFPLTKLGCEDIEEVRDPLVLPIIESRRADRSQGMGQALPPTWFPPWDVKQRGDAAGVPAARVPPVHPLHSARDHAVHPFRRRWRVQLLPLLQAA